MPSVIVKSEYRRVSKPLLRELYMETLKKRNLVVITISKEGHKMAGKALKLVGVANVEKDIRVYKKD